MIIVDDTVSMHTLVSPSHNGLVQRTIPRYLLSLTYISLGFSILPFILALINVASSPVHSIPALIAYVLTAPFNVATLLVMWHIIRETVWIPFNISSKKTISFTAFLQVVWIFSTVMAGLIAANRSPFTDTFCGRGKCQVTFAILTALGACQVLLLGAIGLVITLDYLKIKTARWGTGSVTSSVTQEPTIIKGPRMIGV